MITGDLITINSTPIPKIKGYKIQRAKLWSDAERNMNGEVKATLIGIFPKIEIEIGYTNQTEMQTICDLLDTPFFNATYFDPRTNTTHTAQYYAGDYDIALFDKTKGLYSPFSVSLIPVAKRSY